MSWLRDNGWWLPHASADKPTHLLLDGGKARVPDDSAGAFLNAYTLAVVRGPAPCLVELRTAVFRLFLDLDLAFSAPLDFDAVMRALQARAAAFFDTPEPPRAVVCDTAARPLDTGHTKQGRHVVWTNVYATPATALAFRAACVEDLEAAMPGACIKPWATAVDACVFTSNGLRMPFSAKGRGNPATYVPAAVWVGDGAEQPAVGEVRGVSEVRRWVRELSIRAFGVDETPPRPGVAVAEAPAAGGGVGGVSRSLREYEAVLPALDAALPVQFAGQRFTSVLKAECCYLLRSSSRFCLNRGAAHNSCGVYFILSLKGVRQACFCRCETTEGRRYGMCRDFKSDVWPVSDEVLRGFFGDTAAADVGTAAGPCARGGAMDDTDKLLRLSRNRYAGGGGGRKRQRKP